MNWTQMNADERRKENNEPTITSEKSCKSAPISVPSILIAAQSRGSRKTTK
jgi:hypothetical protein